MHLGHQSNGSGSIRLLNPLTADSGADSSRPQGPQRTFRCVGLNRTDVPFARTGARTITHDGFLRAIIAAPDENTPRLAYADWLDEQGDAARAEFIRTQVELATPDLDADHARALRRREKTLLDAHASAWQRPFRAEQEPRFTRGFVSDLTLSAAELLERGREYLDATPVTRVVLRDGGEDAALIADLGRCDFLGRVQALNLYQTPIGEDAARALFGSPYLTGLRGLHLGEGDATPGMVSIHPSPYITFVHR